MRRRGRPRHPDILTPREWDVLALLRDGLTNEAIADCLGISPDGAKYHVSQILSKLGVTTREEAAAWQVEGTPRQPRLIVAVVGTGALLVVVALGVLAAGVLNDGPGGEARASYPFDTLPTPASPPELSRDQVLARAGRTSGPVSFVDLQPTTQGYLNQRAASSAGPRLPVSAASLSDPTTVWFLRVVGEFDIFASNPARGSAPGTSPFVVACRVAELSMRDVPVRQGDYETSFGAGEPIDEKYCEPQTEISRDLAIVLASRYPQYVSLGQVQALVTADQMTLGEAYAAAELYAGPITTVNSDMGRRVWLVTFGDLINRATPDCPDHFVAIYADTGVDAFWIPNPGTVCR